MEWLDPFNTEDESETALGAAETLLAYGISIAEGKVDDVPLADYRQTHNRLLRDPVARKAGSQVLVRCRTPALLWGHLRSVATGGGSWALRREAAHDLIDPVIDALLGARRRSHRRGD